MQVSFVMLTTFLRSFIFWGKLCRLDKKSVKIYDRFDLGA